MVTTSNGFPNFSTVLGTQSMSADSVPADPAQFVQFSLPASPSLDVHPGEVLGIVLSVDSPDPNGVFQWEGDGSPDTYRRGTAFIGANNTGWFAPQGAYAFKTWVEKPEPSMLVFAAGALACRSRRTRERRRVAHVLQRGVGR
jgi:hypothetical protein